MSKLLEYTDVNAIPAIIADLNRAFQSGLTRPIEYRKKQLRGLYNLIDDNEEAICEALYKDMRRNKVEAISADCVAIKEDVLFYLNNLDKFAKPKKVKPRMSLNGLDTVQIRREPLGTVLIIGPWNYPVRLLLLPAVGAIAAGNTIILKPSEVTENTAALISKLFPRYLDSKSYQIVNGGVQETTELLKHRFDHIFYTGNGTVGKIVATAAAKHLTSITLELGGKSPTIVADDADIDVVANRITYGKWYNAGQTCIAPDYVLISSSRVPALIAAIQKSISTFYGSDPKSSPDLARVVSARHFDRLSALLKGRVHNAHTPGGIAIGGETDEKQLYIAPTVLANVNPDDPAMQDEIFGPILPIVGVSSIEEAIRFINGGNIPLSLYLFTNNKKITEKVISSTRSGAAVINDCLVHAAEMALPFGGTGQSGCGSYHGVYSFNTFTHERSTMIKSLGMEGANKMIRYPPYTEKKLKIIKFVLISTPWFKKTGLKIKLYATAALVAVALAWFVGNGK